MRSPFSWRFTPLFATLLLAGCASTDNIAPQGPSGIQHLRPIASPAGSLLAPKGELTADWLRQRPNIAAQHQLVESYNQTILNTVQETADAITVQQSTAQQWQQAASASQSMHPVYLVANARHQAGLIGRDELLSGQTQLIQQQQAKIGLIRALGGGYQAPAKAGSKA